MSLQASCCVKKEEKRGKKEWDGGGRKNKISSYL